MKNNTFDLLLDIVLHQDGFDNAKKLFTHAKIFNFDEELHIQLRSCEEKDELELYVDLEKIDFDHLDLPFPITVLAFKDCCTMFCKVKGFDTSYMFISYNKTIGMGTDVFQTVITGLVNTNCSNIMSGGVSRVIGMKHSGKWKDVSMPPEQRNSLLPLVYTSLGFLNELNTPDRFILEISPVKTDVRSPKYIPKSHQRPHYIFLHPHIIRKYMKTEHEVGAGTRRGHERRAHNRTYPDDPIKFPKAHGKTIRIEANWIGTTEAIVGNTQYRVILDSL